MIAHNKKISVIDLGYVGLPVAVAFGNKQKVIGFDIAEKRVRELKEGIDRTNEVESDESVKSDITLTCDPREIADEAKQEYGIRLSEFDAMKPAQAVVLAVPHQEYLEQGWKLITDILDDGVGAVLDVKAKLPRDAIPEGIAHWRL